MNLSTFFLSHLEMMAPILKEKTKSDSKITLIESKVMKYHMMFNKNITLFLQKKNITLYTLEFLQGF